MSAFTHSTINSQFSYERLEFLGDSLHKYFLVVWLYHKWEEAKVEQNDLTRMSESKMIFESNLFLSYVAVNHGLHKYLDATD